MGKKIWYRKKGSIWINVRKKYKDGFGFGLNDNRKGQNSMKYKSIVLFEMEQDFLYNIVF